MFVRSRFLVLERNTLMLDQIELSIPFIQSMIIQFNREKTFGADV